MSVVDGTPPDEKVRYWQVPDFERARTEMGDASYAQLVADMAAHEGAADDGAARDLFEAYRDNDPAKFNRHQETIRDVAKDVVTKQEQPEWAWSILSVYSEDVERTILELPSGGYHKGLIVTEPDEAGHQRCFLYSKNANGISDVQHIERHYLNLQNATSMGESSASDSYERVCLKIGDNRVAALEMNYNTGMVATDELHEYLTGKVDTPDKWITELEKLWSAKLNTSKEDPENAMVYWWASGLDQNSGREERNGDEIFDLGDLIRHGYFFNTGVSEFEGRTGNFAFEFPENWWKQEDYSTPQDLFADSRLLIVDSGEYASHDTVAPGSRDAHSTMLQEDPILAEDEAALLKDSANH